MPKNNNNIGSGTDNPFEELSFQSPKGGFAPNSVDFGTYDYNAKGSAKNDTVLDSSLPEVSSTEPAKNTANSDATVQTGAGVDSTTVDPYSPATYPYDYNGDGIVDEQDVLDYDADKASGNIQYADESGEYYDTNSQGDSNTTNTQYGNANQPAQGYDYNGDGVVDQKDYQNNNQYTAPQTQPTNVPLNTDQVVAAPAPIKKEIKKTKKIKKETRKRSKVDLTPNGRFLGVEVGKIGMIAFGCLSLLMLLLLVLEVSGNTISNIVKGEEKTGYEGCKESGGQTGQDYPFRCVDGDGNVFFKETTISGEQEQISIVQENDAKNGIISFEPANLTNIGVSVVSGEDNEMNSGTKVYSDYSSEFDNEPYNMVVVNSNLPSVADNASLISKIDKFLEDGQGLTDGDNVIDLFKFDAGRDFDLVELNKVTNVGYENTDSAVIYYGLDVYGDNLADGDNRLVVRVLAKKNDNYILLEKYITSSVTDKINADYRSSCFENFDEEPSGADKNCYISKIKANITLNTEAQRTAEELVIKFELDNV